MLVRQEVADGVELLGVAGAVGERDAARLATCVERALQLQPRGVVVDLARVTEVSRAAVEALRAAAARNTCWPRPSIAVCAAPHPVADALRPAVPVYCDRDEALRHVDDRPASPRQRVEVPHDLHGPALARSAVKVFASQAGLGGVSDDLALVVSELVTNAIRYAQPPVELEVGFEVDDHLVTVAVRDGDPGRPGPVDAPADAEGGRGLLLIDLLASERGVRPDPPGKTVWAVLPLADGHPGSATLAG